MPVVRRRVRRLEKKSHRKKLILLLSGFGILILCGAIYGFILYSRSQKAVAVDLIVQCGTPLPERSISDKFQAIPVARQKIIYQNALTAVGNITDLSEHAVYDDKYTKVRDEKTIQTTIAQAIHIIAIGNGVSDDDVRKIVRQGWALDW